MILLVCLFCVSCVERTISITSEPAGALVYLNDQEVGRTPLTVPFMFYGTYDVRLEAEGFEPLWTKQKAKTPLWDMPGIDLLAEAVPGVKSQVKWHFDLQPAVPMDQDALLDRAEQMRALVPQKQSSDEARMTNDE